MADDKRRKPRGEDGEGGQPRLELARLGMGRLTDLTSGLTNLSGILAGLELVRSALTNEAITLPQHLGRLEAPGPLLEQLLYGFVGVVFLSGGVSAFVGGETPVGLLVRWVASTCRRLWRPRPPDHTPVTPPFDRPHQLRDPSGKLKELRTRLARMRRVNLYGPEAVGKTPLAVEYVHRQRDAKTHPNGDYWLNGRSVRSLRRDLAELVWRLPVPAEAQAKRWRRSRVRAVADWLRNHDGWLLVVDDVCEQAAASLRRLVVDMPGHVLAISRDPFWPSSIALESGDVDIAWTPLAISKRSLRLVQRERREAKALLALCAFLDGEDIPLGILRDGAGALPPLLRELVVDEHALVEVLGTLRRRGLVDWRDDRLQFGTPSQAAARTALGRMATRHWLGTAIRLLRAVWPAEMGDPDSVRRCAMLLPHVRTVVRLYRAQPVRSEDAAWLLDRMGCYLRERGDLDAAAEALERALAIRERTFRADRLAVATTQHNLGLLRLVQGNRDAAEFLLRRALETYERLLGPDDPDTATALDNLATALWELGARDLVRPLRERALGIRERVLGPDHPATAVSLNNLGTLSMADDQVDAARTLFRRALAILEEKLPGHPDTVNCGRNLAAMEATA